MITVKRFSSKHSMLARVVAQPPSPYRPLEVTDMQGQVAVGAQRDQVLFGVVAGSAAKLLVMNLQV